MKILENLSNNTWESYTQRPTKSFKDIEPTVYEIFEAVQNKGDEAVAFYTQKFDGAATNVLQVTSEELETAEHAVSDDLKTAIITAKNNIYRFHKAQKTERITVETTKGVVCWQEKRPIQKVGLYIPGGSAPLFSTVLMLAIPAAIAGCQEIVLCSPPDKDGNIHPAILFAAQLCGVTQIMKIGGIQAIAALTFGTQTVPKVQKIFGPGNQFVTVAKQIATQFGLAIDMPAGPSELLVVADETANASFVAADLLSQAEHGPDSQVILVSTSLSKINEVMTSLYLQMNDLPRKEVAEKAVLNSKAFYFEHQELALDFINQYAPEHFIIATQNDDFYVDNVQNAGSVFIGHYTPESAGDYASGTNHTLPTNGYAANYSGVNLDSYLKNITFQKISAEGLQNLGETIETMAAAEGLQAHKNAVTIRLNELKKV